MFTLAGVRRIGFVRHLDELLRDHCNYIYLGEDEVSNGERISQRSNPHLYN